MKFLHTMIRVRDLDVSLDFWCHKMGFIEIRRKEVSKGRFTLIFLVASNDHKVALETKSPELELTYNWDGYEVLTTGRSWGHLAYHVDNIYKTCQNLMNKGVVINRPPRDGRMAFVKSPDDISIEFIQAGEALEPIEPWISMKNIGTW